MIAQWGDVISAEQIFVGMLAVGGNDGVNTDNTLTIAYCVKTAVDLVEPFSERVADLVKCDQLDCVLVSNPLQWHAGYVCA